MQEARVRSLVEEDPAYHVVWCDQKKSHTFVLAFLPLDPPKAQSR